MRLLFVLGLTLSLTGASGSAPALKEPPGNDPNLIGEWTLSARARCGPAPWRASRSAGFTADGKRVTRTGAGGDRRAALLPGPRPGPPWIDIRAADGGPSPSAASTDQRGEAHRLRHRQGGRRPGDEPAGSKVYLRTYKRMKKQLQTTDDSPRIHDTTR